MNQFEERPRDGLQSLLQEPRAIPYYRVRELCPPFSKSCVFRLLRHGQLKAIRVGRVLLIDGESVRQLLESADQYHPTRPFG